MADGRIEFEIRANTDNLDGDLENALNKALAGAEEISRSMQPLHESILENAALWGGVLSDTSKNISETSESFIDELTGVTDFIDGRFTTGWSGAWENIKRIFEGIWEGIRESFKTPMNYLVDGINSFICGVNDIKIPEWVPSVGGKEFAIQTIPRLRSGLDYVPGDDFPALLHKGESVLNAGEAAVWRALKQGGAEGLALTASAASLPISNGSSGEAHGTTLFGKAADYFIVREEADIDRIAETLHAKIRAASRGRGGAGL